jgi:hypothetical protein
MIKKRIYVSGKITGLPIEVAYQSFYNAEKLLINLGLDTVNPMTLNHDHDLSWENYMRVDLIALLKCTHIYMLKNWHTSKGANIEYNLAKDLNLTIIFE